MDLYTDEEAAEREALMDRDELIDQGYYETGPQRAYCDLCETPFRVVDDSILCPPCEDYARWHKAQGYESEAS